MASFDLHEQDFKIFSSTFDIDVDLVPERYQIELIELQCASHLREKFRDAPLILYYHALKMVYVFGSTYICLQFFSKMKFTKTKARTNLTDRHLLISFELQYQQSDLIFQ
ncbi:hypothetical protein LOD99_10873 [Oopsacas minuta]|uniref:Uncharacterized protein n=1 Tax=Oopsacas minuta TaxID=111878 RepID=A0AAV7KCS3_9METZ|nr:hypothetical protein LOD99_10873 [Oopsacas minuta]